MIEQQIHEKSIASLAATCTALLTAGVAFSAEPEDATRRPSDLTLTDVQAPPGNRWAFSHLREVMPTVNIPHDGRRVLELPVSQVADNNISLDYLGEKLPLDTIAEQHFIDGILVLSDGQIVVEKYYGALTANRPHLMMSVSKSVIGVLTGALEEQGQIDLSKSVGQYVPALKSSGWGPDSLRTLLDMRDGADYTETYDDPNSTVRLQDCATGWTTGDPCPTNGPIGGYEFFPTIGRNEKNLGKFVYKSGSTDVIGWVLEEVTGRPLPELISTYVWQPMGAEFDAYITADQGGFVLADGGMNATLRDLGRFGQLVLNDGQAFGKQVIPAEFIDDIHNQPGDPEWPYDDSAADWQPYYRSFWWGQGHSGRDIMGLGINGQYLHVAPEAGVVVVIYSSWPRADGDASSDKWGHLYELGAALVEKVSD